MRQIVESIPPSRDEEPKRKLLQDKIESYQQHARNLMALENHTLETPVIVVSECDVSRLTYSPSMSTVAVTDDGQYPSQQTTSNHGSPQKQQYRSEVPLTHSSLWKLRNCIRNQAADEVSKPIRQANAYLTKALDYDELGATDKATLAYSDAAECYIKAIVVVKEKQRKVPSKNWDEILDSIKKRLENVLDRAEELKHNVGSTRETVKTLHRRDLHNSSYFHST